MRILLWAATLAVAGGLAARVQAEPAVPSAAGLERLSAFFENEVTSRRIPGAVLLIQQHGSPVYLRSFGVQDVACARAGAGCRRRNGLLFAEVSLI